MLHDYTNALFVALGLAGLGMGIGRIALMVGERMIENRHGGAGIRDTMAGRAKLESRFEIRRTEREAALARAKAAVEEAVQRRATLERRMKAARQAGETLVRQIGEEVAGTPCWLAMVANKYVGTADFQQAQHAFIDRSWAQPQIVEVWARSMAEARGEIERRYPPAFGYVVTRMQEQGAAPVAAPVARAG